MRNPRRFRERPSEIQTIRLAADNSAAGTIIPFAHNPIATAQRIARALPEMRITATWDNRYREAVHITGADQPMGSGLFVADGEQLVIGDDGVISVEEMRRA